MQDCTYEKSYKKSILKKHLIYIKKKSQMNYTHISKN
jgi:hypothetical protein